MLAALALASGLISAPAQIYSQNIVGFVNNPVPTGFSVQNNPFNRAGGNVITNLIANDGSFDGSYVYIWAGHTYDVYTLDSTMPTGISDAADVVPVPPPTINPGTAFYLNNQTGAALTNTYVGNVALATYPGSTTNAIAGSPLFSLLSSILPLGGRISSDLGFTNVDGALDGDYIYQPVIISGTFHGYNVSTFDSTLSTGFPGFGDASDQFPVPEPVIPLGGGFFFNNANGTPVNWIQTLGQ